MGKRARKKVDWAALNRASLARDREDYRNSTPGQRVEQQLELSYELSRLAARGRARR